MDFIDQLMSLAGRIPSQLEHLHTEEATKTALVMPFINILGFNIFDPTEVVPEYTADVGTKKGEKVDYAILKDGKPIMLFECKTAGVTLDFSHASQLYRYFSVTEARFGILTNGHFYQFYTDTEPNKMDEKPFLEINLLEPDGQQFDQLKQYSKGVFDQEKNVFDAIELKYMTEIRRLFAAELSNPSDEFVKLFASQVYSGNLTPARKEQFRDIMKRATKQHINDQINRHLKSAFANEDEGDAQYAVAEKRDDEETGSEIVTTQEEIDAYHIVKAILRREVDLGRVVMRDAKTYCSVLLDNNNRKPICRFWFNTAQKYLGCFDEKKKEEKIPIESLDDIYSHSEMLRIKISHYDVSTENIT
jgi:hypothetical protein